MPGKSVIINAVQYVNETEACIKLGTNRRLPVKHTIKKWPKTNPEVVPDMLPSGEGDSPVLIPRGALQRLDVRVGVADAEDRDAHVEGVARAGRGFRGWAAERAEGWVVAFWIDR